jgi:hypothetical protein
VAGRTRRRIGYALTADQQTFLLEGDGHPFAGLTVENTFGSMDLARAAWQRHRSRLLLALRGRPGRPWAWWAFDAPPWKHLEPHDPSTPPKVMPPDPDRIMPRDQRAVLKILGLPETP